jgi:hypothetical protein
MARLARTIVVVLATFFLIAAPSASASGVTVSDLDNGATAQTLASSLTGGGVAVSNVTYTGSNRAAGSFTGGTSSIGFDTGLVLSSGKVQTYGGATPDDPCSRGVEGPNNCNEDASATDGGENTTSFGTAGDTDLDALLTGQTTEDAAVLQFDFVPQQSTVHFSYVFSSEEYNDFANSDFNDVFAFFVNGTNCALVPNTTDPVSINNINNGNPLGDATAQMPHNAQYFRDNVRPTPGSIDSQMDGLTTVLTCTANVNAGVTNHMKLAIADVGDSAYDSAVFIAAGSLISGRLLTVNKSGTGTGGVTSSPAGIDCGATCTHSYSDGTMVTLTATADAGSTFTGWSGEGCSGTGQCQVTMDQARTVTAAFSANPPQTLTVSKAGTGTGGVTSSPAGIDCGATCSHGFAGGTVVTLTATESFDSVFAGWSGEGCSGTGTCVVTMSQARNVTATFNLRPIHMITVTKNGSGTGGVTSSPAGIDCGATCSHSYPDGRDIVLTATADAGSVFTGWSGGGCSGTGTCTVNLNGADVNVTATFTANRTLTVSKNGTGSGGVTSSPAGIDCGATCSAQYLDGTSVTLTATAAAGSTFTGWSGEGCSGTGTCVVSMSQARNVTATFDTIPPPPPVNHTLTVTKGGSGSGSVTSSPAGIDCGATCSHSYADGTGVTLTATAAAGSTFTGWSGDCTGTGTCTLTMSADHNVTATFTTVPPVVVPPSVGDGLFCGTQHRGQCKGLPVKGIFDRPGNASWTFDAYNPTPGKGATAAKTSKLHLGQVKKTIKKAGTVTIVFKLHAGAKTNKLYRQVKKLKLHSLLITLRFTDKQGVTVVQTKTIKLKV